MATARRVCALLAVLHNAVQVAPWGSVSAATISPYGSELIIKLEEPVVSRGNTVGLVPCTRLLSNETLDLLQGGSREDPGCFWADDSTLVAQVMYNASLRPGMGIELRSMGSGESACEGERPACFAGGAVVTSNCSAPVAVISGPATVPDCPGDVVHVRLDGSYSRGCGRPLQFIWTVAEAGVVLDQTTRYDGAVDVRLPPTETRFTFTLRVVSPVDGAESEATWTMARTPASPSPILTLQGPFQAWPGVALVVHTELALAPCWPSEALAAVELAWTVTNVTRTSTGEPAVPPSEVVGLNASTLFIPAHAVLGGHQYVFHCSARMAAVPAAEASAWVTVSIGVARVRAAIVGGSRRVLSSRSLILRGGLSTDPNGPGHATFAWTLAPLEGQSAAGAEALVGADEEDLGINTAALEAGAWRATLTYATAWGEDSTSVDLNVTEAADTLELVINGPSEVEAAHNWRLPARRLGVFARAVHVPGVEFSWAVRELDDAGGGDASPVNLSDAATTTGFDQRAFALTSGALAPGAAYALELTAVSTATGSVGSAQVLARTLRPPFGGLLRLEPASGDALTTVFEATADGWSAHEEVDHESWPLTFAFSLVAAPSGPVSLGAASGRNWARLLLPAGDVEIRVLVSDSLGAAAEAQARARVAASNTSCPDWGARVGEAEALVQAGQQVDGRHLVLLAALGSGGACLTDNGTATVASAAAHVLLDSATDLYTPEVRMHVTAVAASLLERAGDMDGGAQAATLAAVLQATAQSADEGVDGATLAHVFRCLSAVLAPGAQAAAAESDVVAINALVASIAAALGPAVLVGAVPGEAWGGEALPSLAWGAKRFAPESLEGHSVSLPGSGGNSRFPSTVFAGHGALSRGVDMTAYNVVRNVHGSAALEGHEDEGSLQTGVYGMSLFDASSAAPLAVRNLREAIVHSIPLHGVDLARAEACEDDAGCGPLATCVQGACTCVPPRHGRACSLVAECHFWEAGRAVWSTEGCATVPAPAGAAPGNMYCACTHLTDFAGIRVPTTAAEAEADVASFAVNSISAFDLAAVLTEPAVAEHQTVLFTTIGLAAACAVHIAVLVFKDWLDSSTRRLRDSLTNGRRPSHRLPRSATTGEDDATAAARAALVIQRMSRGLIARRRYRSATRRQRRAHPSFITVYLSTLLQGHLLLGMWFDGGEGESRAERAATFWVCVMTSLALAGLLFDARPPPPGADAPRLVVVHLVLSSVIVAAVTIPVRFALRTVMSWGYAWPSGTRPRGASATWTVVEEKHVALGRRVYHRAVQRRAEAIVEATARAPARHYAAYDASRVVPLGSGGASTWPEPPSTPEKASVYEALDEVSVGVLRGKFRHYDLDASGAVSETELAPLLEDMGFRLRPSRVRGVAAQITEGQTRAITVDRVLRWYDGVVDGEARRQVARQRGPCHGLRRGFARLSPAARRALGAVRLGCAWTVAGGLFAAAAVVAVVFARSFGDDATRQMLVVWALAEAQSLVVEEPAGVFVSVAMSFAVERLRLDEGKGGTCTALVLTLARVLCLAPDDPF